MERPPIRTLAEALSAQVKPDILSRRLDRLQPQRQSHRNPPLPGKPATSYAPPKRKPGTSGPRWQSHRVSRRKKRWTPGYTKRGTGP
jgi:hypothetical protein